MFSAFCVAAGGAIGAVSRYLIGLIRISETTVFPYKTLIINIAGSFIIGLISAYAANKSGFNPDLLLFLKVGICGGFTTFSTFAFETADLLHSGKPAAAFAYIALSIVLSVGAVFLAQIAVNSFKSI